MRKTFLVMSRLIDLFVDILPIDELGFKHVKLQSEGRPPYNCLLYTSDAADE